MRVLKPTTNNLLVASQVVKGGGLMVYPTDTVYGLGCDPFNVEAVNRIFQAKGRRKKPLPVLASDIEYVAKIAILSERVRKAASRFWPGQLTLVVPKRPALPDVVTCGVDSVGVRIPKHDIAVQLIRLCGGLLIGTSANKTGEEPPRTAEEATRQLGEDVDIVLDGGPTTFGMPSTVVDLTAEEPKIIRGGLVSSDEVLKFFRRNSDNC